MSDEIRNAANRRGRAYRCLYCSRQGKVDFIAERFRVESHVYKHHVPLDRVPFSCTVCLFRCTTRAQYEKHLTSYSWHKQRGGSPRDGSDCLNESANPYVLGDYDMEMLSKEQSVQHFINRSRQSDRSPAKKRQDQGDMLEMAMRASGLDSSETSVGEVVGGQQEQVEITIYAEAADLDGPEALDLSAPDSNNEPFDSRVVCVKARKEVVKEVEQQDDRAEDILPGLIGQGEVQRIPDSPNRRRSPSPASSSSSSSSASSASSQQQRLVEALVGLVKKSSDMVQYSVDRTMEMVQKLNDTIEGQSSELSHFSKVLGDTGRIAEARDTREVGCQTDLGENRSDCRCKMQREWCDDEDREMRRRRDEDWNRERQGRKEADDDKERQRRKDEEDRERRRREADEDRERQRRRDADEDRDRQRRRDADEDRDRQRRRDADEDRDRQRRREADEDRERQRRKEADEDRERQRRRETDEERERQRRREAEHERSGSGSRDARKDGTDIGWSGDEMFCIDFS